MDQNLLILLIETITYYYQPLLPNTNHLVFHENAHRKSKLDDPLLDVANPPFSTKQLPFPPSYRNDLKCWRIDCIAINENEKKQEIKPKERGKKKAMK